MNRQGQIQGTKVHAAGALAGRVLQRNALRNGGALPLVSCTGIRLGRQVAAALQGEIGT
jgi:hypothetical protein